jgi:competence protein ComEC
VAAWPGAVKVLPAMPNHALTVMAMAGLWLCLWRPTRPAPGGTILGLGGLGMAMVLWLTASPPSLLIDGNARLFGMVTADGQLRVSNRRDSFTLRNWLAGQGLAEASPLSSQKKTGAGAGDMSDLRCDALGCLYRRNGQTVSLVRDLRALADDCSLAGAIISTLPLRRNCLQAPIRIDRFDLWRNGAHALWIDDEGNMRVRSVAASRGQRPWTPVRQRPVRQRPEKLRPERSKQANNRGLAVQSNK